MSINTYVLDWNEDLVVGFRVQKGRVSEVAELHLQLHSVLPEVTHALLLRQWFRCRVDLGYCLGLCTVVKSIEGQLTILFSYYLYL